MRAMLRSTRSRSTTAAGVPYSRAILAARGVVIKLAPVSLIVIARSEATKQSTLSFGSMDYFSSLAMTVKKYGLSLLYPFTQYFKFQPLVFGLMEFFLRFCQRVRGLVEFLAILLVEIGGVNVSLL